MPGVAGDRVQVTPRGGRAGRARLSAAAARRARAFACASSRFPTARSSGASRCRPAASKSAGPSSSRAAWCCGCARAPRCDDDEHDRILPLPPRRCRSTSDATRTRRRPVPPARARGASTRPLPDDALIVLPVRNLVVFPATVLPIGIGRERSQAAVQEAVRLERPIGVLLQSKPDVDEPGPDDLHWVGTSAAVLRYMTAPDGSAPRRRAGPAALPRAAVPRRLSVHGRARAVHRRPGPQRPGDRRARARALKERALETLQLLPQVPAEMGVALQGIDEPAQLADFIAGVIDVPRRGEAVAARDLRPEVAPRPAARARSRAGSRC